MQEPLNPGQEPEEEGTPMLELMDQEGNKVTIEVVDQIEHEGEVYLVVAEPDDMEGPDEEVEVMVLRYEEDEQGKVLLKTVDDDALAEAILDIVNQRAEEALGSDGEE